MHVFTGLYLLHPQRPALECFLWCVRSGQSRLPVGYRRACGAVTLFLQGFPLVPGAGAKFEAGNLAFEMRIDFFDNQAALKGKILGPRWRRGRHCQHIVVQADGF